MSKLCFLRSLRSLSLSKEICKRQILYQPSTLCLKRSYADGPVALPDVEIDSDGVPNFWGYKKKSMTPLKIIVCFISLPIILLMSVQILCLKEHEEVNPEDYVPYEYLNIRTRPYFFGDGRHTLFYNPKRNVGQDL